MATRSKIKEPFQSEHVPKGKYDFNVMPFGLRNAGATYQRFMDICLSGLASDRIVAYLDDVIIFSQSWEEHLEDLDKLFYAFE